jgi:hypothetical protein
MTFARIRFAVAIGGKADANSDQVLLRSKVELIPCRGYSGH